MKLSKLLIGILCCVSSHYVFANDVCKQMPGTMYCHDGSVDSINFLGTVNLDGTTVVHGTTVTGSLNVENSVLNTLNVRGDTVISASKVNETIVAKGDVNVKDLTIAGPVSVFGNFMGKNFVANAPVKIKGVVYCNSCTFHAAADFKGDIDVANTEFQANVSIVALKSTFKNSKLNDININIDAEDKPQVIILDDNATVHNVTFANQKGTVFMSKNSKITGNIAGGIVKPL